MKTLLATLLCLLTFTASAQDWPKNKAGKVEFKAVLPWPATARTEAQRQAVVRRWYMAKLTDSSREEVAADAATNKTNGLLTYAGLPKIAVLQVGSGDSARYLAYNASLTALKSGLSIVLSRFNINQREDEPMPLEPYLTHPTQNEQAALAALRKRLAAAVAGWN